MFATDEPITKLTRIIPRADGSEVKIVAQRMYCVGLHASTDVYVLRRESPEHDWTYCSDRPHPDWRTMSVAEYIDHGRSPMLQTVSIAEILKLTSMLGKPMSSLHNSELS